MAECSECARLRARLDQALAALTEIRDRCGAVCADFLECRHAPCNSSAHARIVAGDALSGLETEERRE